MGGPQSPSSSPFTPDERIQIKECVEGLIQEHFKNKDRDVAGAFQNARLALYESFIETYLAPNAKFPPNFQYHTIFRALGDWKATIHMADIKIFTDLRTEWDITALGYLFEFLRGLQVSIEGSKIEVVTERTGNFRSKTGAVFTPYDICVRMVGNAIQLFSDTYHDNNLISTILDPACGGGAFLIAAARDLYMRYPIKKFKDIVLRQLYGIDVDPEAVLISRLSLWGLVGDPDFDIRTLTHNIIGGNTLLPRNAPAKLSPLIIEEVFPEVFTAGGFNIVIGNPPYVRQEKIREMKPYLIDYKSYSPTADLYMYFFEKGFDLLKSGGILSFIASNSFLRTRSARPLRVFLKENTRITSFFDAFQGPVFAAGVTPCILTFQKVSPFGTVRINDDDEMPQSSLEDRAWNFLPDNFLQLLGKMDQCRATLADYCAVYFCIKPGRVRDFVLTPAQISHLKLEESLFQPVLRGTDVKQYIQPAPKVSILFPYNKSTFERLDWQVIAENFPHIHQYLLDRRVSLEARDDYQRNKDHMMWYELRPCNYYPEFRQPKILTPDICHTNSFTLETQGSLCLDTIFMIRPRDITFPLEFWLGFLNSHPVEFFLKMTSASLGTRGFRYKKQFLEKIPIPSFDKNSIGQINNLARENMCVNKPLHQSEIDKLVYESFLFEEEEIRLVNCFLQGLS